MFKRLIHWLKSSTSTQEVQNRELVEWLSQRIMTADNIEELTDDLKSAPTVVLQFVMDVLPSLIPEYAAYHSKEIVIVLDFEDLGRQVVSYLQKKTTKPNRVSF